MPLAVGILFLVSNPIQLAQCFLVYSLIRHALCTIGYMRRAVPQIAAAGKQAFLPLCFQPGLCLGLHTQQPRQRLNGRSRRRVSEPPELRDHPLVAL